MPRAAPRYPGRSRAAKQTPRPGPAACGTKPWPWPAGWGGRRQNVLAAAAAQRAAAVPALSCAEGPTKTATTGGRICSDGSSYFVQQLHECARRGRFRCLPQHHHSSRCLLHDQRQVCCLPRHHCTPCSAGLPGNDIQDPTTWDADNLCTLKRLHVDLLQQYDCTEQAAPHPPPPSAGGSAAANAGAHPQPPRTTAMASSSYRNSTAFIWHSSGGRCPPQRPPALKTSRPSSPRSDHGVRHPFPTPCHGAAHQALGALQSPASALRRHAFRGAAPASPPAETQGHGPRLHPARGDEQPRRAGRQRQGTRALLEAPLMARRHQAHT